MQPSGPGRRSILSLGGGAAQPGVSPRHELTAHGPRSIFFAHLSTTAILGCSSSRDEQGTGADCRSSLTSYSSPATGVLTLTGSFYSDETVYLTDTTQDRQDKQATVTPPSDRNSVTFASLPSGTLSYNVTFSCSEGQEDTGDHTYVIK